uniref:H(+)-transporting two-sector ATPase n=1 Tax=Ditylenchus dipsaci TaxID=166011 RepID=A0A915ENH8_9BILA
RRISANSRSEHGEACRSASHNKEAPSLLCRPYVPADDLTDPAPATTFAHLDATTVLSRGIAELAIYPAVDPLDSTSRIMDPNIVGQRHYDVARGVQKILQDYKSLQTSSLFWEWMNYLKTISSPTQYHQQCYLFYSGAEVFTGHAGKFVSLEQTIDGFESVLRGELDHIQKLLSICRET